jgi:hypothetical protein
VCDEDNSCNLCAPYLRSNPYSFENLLAIANEERFQHAVDCYRDTRQERVAIRRERDRRRRAGLLPVPNPCADCGEATWHDSDRYCLECGERRREAWRQRQAAQSS